MKEKKNEGLQEQEEGKLKVVQGVRYRVGLGRTTRVRAACVHRLPLLACAEKTPFAVVAFSD